MAESTTENLFREFYGASTFVEKRDIPKKFGFRSKREGSTDDGFPDFFKDLGSWLIVVEAKSGESGPKSDHAAAEADVRSYMTTNAVPHSDIVGIAVSGQTQESLRVTHFFRKAGTEETRFEMGRCTRKGRQIAGRRGRDERGHAVAPWVCRGA